ncbi:hypothetical protein AB0G05_36255 [Nonomuraea wenchangensis]
MQGIGAGALFVLPTIALSELHPPRLRSRMLQPDTPYALLAVGIGVLGVGFGLLMQNLVVVAQNAVSPADLAATTSAAVSVRGLGLLLGVALFGSLLARELPGPAPSRGRPPPPSRTCCSGRAGRPRPGGVAGV